MINIVVPMAGAGSRFSRAGFSKPKPFIDVNGKPMILRVLDNLYMPDAHFTLIARREHLVAESLIIQQIESAYPETFIGIDDLTEGTACTVLHSRKIINKNIPLLIANSDQIVDFSVQDFVDDCLRRELDGSILTFLDDQRDPKWSFARIGNDGLVLEVKEKEAISSHATVGIYLFRRGLDFVDGAIDMILSRDRVNNEYYTCPIYNYLVRKGLRIGCFDVPPHSMHGLGTPEDLEAFLNHEHL